MSAAICSFPSIDAAVRHDDPDHPDGRADRALRAARRQRRARGQRATTSSALREAPMLLMEFHGSAGRREGAGRDGAGDRQRARRRGLRVGQHARGAHAAVDGAPQRLLRRACRRSPAAAPSPPTPACRSRAWPSASTQSVAEAEAVGPAVLHRRPRRRRQLPPRLPDRPERRRDERETAERLNDAAGAARAARWKAPAPASTASACTRWASWSTRPAPARWR